MGSCFPEFGPCATISPPTTRPTWPWPKLWEPPSSHGILEFPVHPATSPGLKFSDGEDGETHFVTFRADCWRVILAVVLFRVPAQVSFSSSQIRTSRERSPNVNCSRLS